LAGAVGHHAHEEDEPMSKWKALYFDTLGVLGQASCAVLRIVGASEGAPGAVLSGGILDVAGLLLWGAGARERGRAESEQEAAMSSSRTDQLLFELQRAVLALRADHDALIRAQLLASRDASAELLLPGPRREESPEMSNTPLPPQ
jgi:hypothetical protein